MIPLIYLWGLSIIFTNADKINPSPITFLTNGTQKTWYLAAETPEEDMPSCKASSPQSMDNTYTFYADGRFEFDNGEITEDSDCMDEGCCSDLVSFTGTWEFNNGGKSIKIFALHKKGDPAYVLNEILFEADVELLEEDKLIISMAGAALEFRPK